MNKVIGSFVILFLILVSSQSTGATTDYTKIGVSNGDGFNFMLDEYTRTEDNKTTHNMSIGYDDFSEDEFFVVEGEQFRMVVGNATPAIDEEWGEATLLVIVETESGTFQTHESLDGMFISTTDWDGLRAEFEEIFGEIESLDPNGVFNIIDTSSEFGIEVRYSYSESDEYGNNTGTVDGEVRFNKNTGVMKIFDVTSSATYEYGSSTSSYSERTKIHFIPEVNSDGPLSLPGFELYLSVLGLLATIQIIKKKES